METVKQILRIINLQILLGSISFWLTKSSIAFTSLEMKMNIILEYNI